MNIDKKQIVAPHVCMLLYLVFLFLLSALTFLRPAYNFDTLPYMGLVAEHSLKTDEDIHRAVFENLKAPPEKFRELTASEPFRVAVYENPEIFREQLPWYRCRYLYTAISVFLHGLGLSLFASVQLISSLSFFAVGLLLWHWLRRYTPGLIALAIAAATQISLFPVGRQATPDMLYALFALGAFFLLIEKRRPHLALGLLLASLTVRNDGVTLVLAVLAYVVFIAPGPMRLRFQWAMLYGGAAVAIAFVLARVSGHYGWVTLMNEEFYGLINRPAHFSGMLSLRSYVRIVFNGLISMPSSAVYLFGILYLVACYITSRFRKVPARLYYGLAACLLLATAARYLIFPVVFDRNFVTISVMFLVLAVRVSSAQGDSP